MKEFFDIVFNLWCLVVGTACAVAGLASAWKGDPNHIWVAYVAGSYVFLHWAEKGW